MILLAWFGLVVLVVFVIGLLDCDGDNSPIHHDSRPGSFYEISNRKYDVEEVK
jgi:hypothetical protein